MRLENKVTLVTGGNSGIGRAITLLAAREGAIVVIAARNKERGAETVQAVQDDGGRAVFISADLRDEQEVRRLIDQILKMYSELHVLVNNAGAGAKRSGVNPTDSASSRWAKLVDANFTSAYLVSSYALPAIRASGGGAIVNISSTAAVHGNYGIYGAAKAGVEGLTRGLAVEAAPDGIRVNCVSPGWISTAATYPADNNDQDAQVQRAAWEREASLLRRMGRPEEVAQAVVFLASEQASFISGATLLVDGGLTVIDPTAQSWLQIMGGDAFSTGARESQTE